jgi:hypothetical protein
MSTISDDSEKFLYYILYIDIVVEDPRNCQKVLSCVMNCEEIDVNFLEYNINHPLFITTNSLSISIYTESLFEFVS